MSNKNRLLQSIGGLARGAAGGLVCLSIVWPGVAVANLVGTDAQNFNPTTSGLDLVTVQTSKTLGGLGHFGLGLWFNWATNTLPYFESSGVKNRDEAKRITDSLTSMDLVGSVGLTENWDIGLALPYVLGQTVRSDDPHGQFGDKGNTEIRATTKYRLWSSAASGIAVGGSVNFNRVKNNPYTGTGGSPTYNLELIGDTKIADVTLAANVGYRFRGRGEEVQNANGETPIEPLDNQVIASVGAGYNIPGTAADIIGEIYGGKAGNEVSKVSPRETTSMEALAGVRYHIRPELALHSGVGTELIHSLSSPDLRVYAGITWVSGTEKKAAPAVVEAVPVAPVEVVPAAVVAASEFPKPDEVIILRDVLFNFNSSELNHKTAQRSLKTLMSAIKGPKGLSKLIIEGHTCSMGSDSYNLSLSRRRAAAIKKWLVHEFSMKSSEVMSVGYGESRPVATNKTATGRELNRRVEIKIYHADNPGFAKK